MPNTPSPAGLAASCRAFALQCQPYGVATVLNDAADEIERLQEAAMQGVNLGIATGLEMAADPTRDAAIEEAAKALEPFASAGERAHESTEDERLLDVLTVGSRIVVGDLRRAKAALDTLRALSTQTSGEASAPPPLSERFQARVGMWMEACFTSEIIADKVERADRFIEESLELVQATGYSPERAHALVDYVFGRPIGEPSQEVGGVMVTLAALCNPHGLDMDAAAETELARIWTKIDKIRAKQAAKPVGSALPQASPTPAESGAGARTERMLESLRQDVWQVENTGEHFEEARARLREWERWLPKLLAALASSPTEQEADKCPQCGGPTLVTGTVCSFECEATLRARSQQGEGPGR